MDYGHQSSCILHSKLICLIYIRPAITWESNFVGVTKFIVNAAELRFNLIEC